MAGSAGDRGGKGATQEHDSIDLLLEVRKDMSKIFGNRFAKVD